ncbi:MAG: efflux RND transporter permease subunit [Myxococcota bacterium]|nr:efflux RND transporter permease subunit [Myxococcota bacterium]MDW8361035.1 efflux RND transporter permease subunit [Myxococcales bacterium]
MTLSELSVRRPVFTTMVSVAIVVLGLVALGRLPVNLFPDVQLPVVTVVTVYPGAGPQQVEREVTRHVEDAVAGINGVDQIFSWSRDSVSQVMIAFELDVDLDEAAAQVRERVEGARFRMPREVEAPRYERMDVGAAPIAIYTFSGPMPVDQLRQLAERRIAPELERVDGVAAVRVRGGADREVHVDVDLEALRAHGISLAQLVERIGGENVDVPAGSLREGHRQLGVRATGRLRDVQALARLPVATTEQGAIVRLADVARVREGLADVEEIVRTNGVASVVLDVMKASGRNTVEVARGVRERFDALRLPEGVRAELVVDQSEFILENAREVQIALLFGGAMAVLVILLFMLDLRSTLISAVALPTSVIGTFLLMWVLDFSINMMTLLGLSLAIGLLIDDSIVVRENIVKHLERGASPVRAAIDGTREITLAVLATTATLCAVFVPVAFTGGIVGQFFQEFGITVAGATVLSTWVALTLDPMLSSRFARPLDPASRAVRWSAVIVRPLRAFYAGMDAVYAATLRWIVARRSRMGAVAGAALLVLGGSCSLLPLMGSEFVPLEDRGQFHLDFELPAGTSLEETSRRSAAAEAELLRDRRFRLVHATIGVFGDPHAGSWRLIAVPKWERDVGLLELQRIARRVVARHMPEAKVSMGLPAIVEGARNWPIAIYVRGERFEDLERVAHRFAERMRAVPGATDVDVSFARGKPELRFEIRHDRAAQMGAPTALVAATLRTAMHGAVAGTLSVGDEELDVRVRVREEDRASVGLLGRLVVPTAGGFVPLSDLATVRRDEGPAVIERLDRSRTIRISASPGDRPLGDVVAEMLAAIGREPLPPGVDFVLEGDAKLMNESNENLGLALWLGIVFIYLVLASQFESFVHPLTIMLALPLAVVGAMLALFLHGSAMNMGAMIGLILLMGLVTKNGILLVDHAVVRVRAGASPREAILSAGAARLRPILMTSAAMVLGMLPTALAGGAGSEFRAPMALAVIGGVISSTVLTLLVLPVFYLGVEHIRAALRRRLLVPASGAADASHGPIER